MLPSSTMTQTPDPRPSSCVDPMAVASSRAPYTSTQPLVGTRNSVGTAHNADSPPTRGSIRQHTASSGQASEHSSVAAGTPVTCSCLHCIAAFMSQRQLSGRSALPVRQSLCLAERVKVIIRVRPAKRSETGKAMEILGKALVLHRE